LKLGLDNSYQLNSKFYLLNLFLSGSKKFMRRKKNYKNLLLILISKGND